LQNYGIGLGMMKHKRHRDRQGGSDTSQRDLTRMEAQHAPRSFLGLVQADG
jgi:hypothetical protein